jgi:hypothetical protein
MEKNINTQIVEVISEIKKRHGSDQPFMNVLTDDGTADGNITDMLIVLGDISTVDAMLTKLDIITEHINNLKIQLVEQAKQASEANTVIPEPTTSKNTEPKEELKEEPKTDSNTCKNTKCGCANKKDK